MAEKKMTQVQALEIALDKVDGEAAEVIANMIAKRKAPRKPRVNKEAEAFRAELVAYLDEVGTATNAELAAHFEVKPQKVANNIRVLEKAGTVERIRGEKASDKDSFKVA